MATGSNTQKTKRGVGGRRDAMVARLEVRLMGILDGWKRVRVLRPTWGGHPCTYCNYEYASAVFSFFEDQVDYRNSFQLGSEDSYHLSRHDLTDP